MNLNLRDTQNTTKKFCQQIRGQYSCCSCNFDRTTDDFGSILVRDHFGYFQWTIKIKARSMRNFRLFRNNFVAFFCQSQRARTTMWRTDQILLCVHRSPFGFHLIQSLTFFARICNSQPATRLQFMVGLSEALPALAASCMCVVWLLRLLRATSVCVCIEPMCRSVDVNTRSPAVLRHASPKLAVANANRNSHSNTKIKRTKQWNGIRSEVKELPQLAV